jgi:hypothetical protein
MKNMPRFASAMIWSTDLMIFGKAALSVRVVAVRSAACA